MRSGVGRLLVGSLGGLAFLDYLLGCPLLYSVFCAVFRILCRVLYVRVLACLYLRGVQCSGALRCFALLCGRIGVGLLCVHMLRYFNAA